MATRRRNKDQSVDESAEQTQRKTDLAQARAETKAVNAYLDALAESRGKRGRPRTAESIQRQLKGVEEAYPTAKGAERVLLIQRRADLSSELNNLEAASDLPDLEAAFIEVAASYSERKGISYASWREVGVPPAVLKAAGVPRGRL